MGELSQGWRDVRSILTDAGRVLASTWPALICVFLIGFALRSVVVLAAIKATLLDARLGQAIAPLAPLAVLLALVVMLRIAWRSFPSQAARPEPFTQQLAEDLRLGTSLMIPFIAVYASAGLLHEDNLAFLRGIYLDELARNGILGTDWTRFSWVSGVALFSAVALALIIRWALIISGLPRRSWRWAALGAYVEAVWVSTLASALRIPLRDLSSWFVTTRMGEVIIGSYLSLVSLLGPLAPIVRSAASWLGANAVAMATLVFLPLAWLAIGQTAADAEHEPSPPPRSGLLGRSLGRPVTDRARKLAQPAWEPVSDLIRAIRHLIVAGWVPMVSFSVLFFLTGQVRVLVAFIGRAILGPQNYADYVATKPYVLMVELTVYLTVIVALMTGAVRLIERAFARANARPRVPVQNRPPSNGAPAYGAPPHVTPAHGAPPRGTPQGAPPRGTPTQGAPPRGAPQHGSRPGVPPPQVPPPRVPPPRVPPPQVRPPAMPAYPPVSGPPQQPNSYGHR